MRLSRSWRCRERVLALGERTLLMAIINVTPDSFSGDGFGDDVAAAVAAGQRAVEAGADLLDIGGESTRPRNEPVAEEEELRRVVPVLERLARAVPVPISVDTSKPQVAAAALQAGAQIINDVSGLAAGDALARVVAAGEAGLVLMRFPGFPYNRPAARDPAASDLLQQVRGDLLASVDTALAAGVPRNAIAIDPGFGFGLLAEDSLELLRRLAELRDLDYPLLVGVSRKGFTGRPFRLPVAERQWGTAAAHALAIAGGADILRVHDVAAARRVAGFTDLVVRNAQTHDLWLSMGSNLGQRERLLAEGLAALEQSGIAIGAVSSLYATAPQGLADQPEFLNCVARATTALPPRAALAACRDVEERFGRQRTLRWGPRTLDIDILFYDDLHSSDPALVLPHPRLWQRAFVLAPLLELWPDLPAPTDEPAQGLLDRLLADQPARAVSGPDWWRPNGGAVI